MPGQMTNGTTKAARKARVARAQCKQQFDAWRADPSNCNLQPFYFCNLHISFDVPRLEAVLNRAAELTGCAGRDNVDGDAEREGGKERRIIGENRDERASEREGRSPPPKSSVKPPCSLSHCPATSEGWPRPGARWCPAMDPGREVSPWNSSTSICHDLSWPPNPVRSDVQIQCLRCQRTPADSASGQYAANTKANQVVELSGNNKNKKMEGLQDKSHPSLCTENGLVLENPSLVRRLGTSPPKNAFRN